jgi:uncharacterized protein
MADIAARQVEDGSSLGARRAPAPAAGEGRAPQVLWPYFLLSCLALLASAWRYLLEVNYPTAITAAFTAAALLSYLGAAMLALLFLVLCWAWLILWRRLDGALGGRARFRAVLAYAPAVTAFSITQIFVFADVFIYKQWAHHIDRFIWNLLTTPGGPQSMDMGTNSTVSFTLIVVGLVAFQAALMVVVASPRAVGRALRAAFPPRLCVVGLAVLVLVLLAAFQAITYGACRLRGHQPVLRAAYAIPGFVAVSFGGLGRKMGWEAPRAAQPRVKLAADAGMNYPLHPLQQAPNAKRYNVVYLVVESWRGDAVDPQIMPRTHAFAEKSVWFRHHFSGGNCTRMGMFTAFYGLYGSYWFPMLDNNRSPVVMDLFQADGYDIHVHTSQSFTYPEFDRTIFVHVPPERMHVIATGPANQRDRQNVDDILAGLDSRPKDRPFMRFMFFETTHAKYDFLPRNVVRKPYMENFNYATMTAKDAPLIKNRYYNSANCLDENVSRVLEYLDKNALLGSTIVVLTGDHAEEFWEAGRYGHAAEKFHNVQEVVPLILHVPGQAPRQVTRLTSHLDIAPTVLKLLGVTNPTEDYGQGLDLLGGPARSFTVMNGWSSMCYMDADCKIIFPFSGQGAQDVVTPDDRPIPDDQADRLLRQKLPQRIQLLRDMQKFCK